MIVRIYGEYRTQDSEEQLNNGRTIICRSHLMDNIELGYNKIIVESPLLDEAGNKILKKGKPVADSNKRDTENVPLNEDINSYFAREVLPYKPDAWIDKSKTKVGYEIPFIRTFYIYKELEKADDIATRIEEHESALMEKLHELFGGEA